MMLTEDQLYSVIGQRIQSIRERRGLTQEGLAANVGLSRASVSNIERGKQKTQVHTLWQISRALGISMIHLLSHLDCQDEISVEAHFSEMDELDQGEQDWVRRILNSEEGFIWGN